MSTKRLCPHKEFPSYAFRPGKHIHPNKEGGHSYGEGEPSVDPLDPDNPYQSEAYLYAIDLFNYGYFWESHVWWEALWNAHQRVGDEANLLKGLIKLAAWGIKKDLGQLKAAQGHLDRAIELLGEVSQKHEVFTGIELSKLINLLKENPTKVSLNLSPNHISNN